MIGLTMIEQTLFSLAGTPDFDLERTGGMHVAVDQAFSTAARIQLDDTSWIDHIQGWLAGDGELMETLMKQASWEQRSRWMYTRMITEPRLRRPAGSSSARKAADRAPRS
jgi:hypothetical protein